MTRTIKFSEKLMNRHGNIAYKAFQEVNWAEKLIKYVIDRKFRERVNLTYWLKPQLMNPELISLVKRKKWDKISDNDRKVIEIMRFVRSRVTYVRDSERWGTVEKWQKAFETYEMKTGDCEDQAILITVLSRIAGVPYYRIWVECGWLKTRNGSGGHAYTIYLSNNLVLYILDTTAYYDKRRINQRMSYYDLGTLYLGRWWSFNDYNGWGRCRFK